MYYYIFVFVNLEIEMRRVFEVKVFIERFDVDFEYDFIWDSVMIVVMRI